MRKSNMIGGLLLGAALGAAPASADPLDVVGVRIGISLPELRAQLVARRPALQIETLGMTIPELGPNPNIWFVKSQTADRPGHPQTIEHINATLTMPPGKSVVWAVSRSVHYLDADQPATAATVAALRAKYGQESLSFGIRQLYWGWDEHGARMSTQQMRQCASYVGMNRMMGTQDTVNRPNPVPPQQAACPMGHYVAATIVPAHNPDVVSDLGVDIADAAIDTIAMAATRAARAQAQSQGARRQLDQAKRNKPDL
jgi:hypothetical protein